MQWRRTARNYGRRDCNKRSSVLLCFAREASSRDSLRLSRIKLISIVYLRCTLPWRCERCLKQKDYVIYTIENLKILLYVSYYYNNSLSTACTVELHQIALGFYRFIFNNSAVLILEGKNILCFYFCLFLNNPSWYFRLFIRFSWLKYFYRRSCYMLKTFRDHNETLTNL